MAGRRKKHYSPEQWVDFVNGELTSELREAMQIHLDGRCGSCSEMLKIWTRVKQMAWREASYDVPESAVRHVRGVFGLLAEPRKAKRGLEIPRLVFDSLWQPAVAGVRSAAGMPRQVVYKTGEVAIEMSMDPEPLSERVNITGQVYDTAKQGEGLKEILVVVADRKRAVAQTKTNRFGEFQLSFVPEKGLRISFGVARGRDLSIPLDEEGAGILSEN
jgi:hypothetical protein